MKNSNGNFMYLRSYVLRNIECHAISVTLLSHSVGVNVPVCV